MDQGIDWKKRKVSVLFLCDWNDPHCACNEIFCGSICKHTTELKHSVVYNVSTAPRREEMDERFDWLMKFLNEKCVSYVTEDRIVFEEIDDVKV